MKNSKHPLLTVDAVITAEDGKIIFIRRKNPPYQGSWAFPGGFVEYGETVEEAVLREVKEETGISIEIQDLLGVYSDPERDPRGHMITVCFLATKTEGDLKADTDAEEVSSFTPHEALEMDLAFDHHEILKDALEKI
ncbi:NUDIX domain-containing protein [Methanobacterium petrolearium]|uniref:NUDIX domain-containing protein n=1 Tax=Methanobacterium petrolearium TaxID=710190 RepID=UPI003CC91D27